MTESKSRLKAIVTPLAIVLVGVAIFAALRSSRPDAKTKTITESPLIVDVQKAIAQDTPINIEAQGTATPAQKIELRSEVTGRLVWKSENLIPGGRVTQGAALARLDGRDYEIALRQQEAALGRARLELQVESGRKKVAAREWAMLKRQKTGGNTLALREPQYAAAQMSLEAAESGLQKAQLNLDRTTIRAPFNGFVENQKTDIGQFVTPQQPFGSFVGSDKFWVTVKIPSHKLAWIDFPKSGQKGSLATVWQEVGAQRVVRQGRVLQLAGNLDPAGRLAQVLIEIEDPLGLKTKESESLPMLLGSFVNVDIQGKTMTRAVEVPRRAIQEGSKVLVMNKENRLEIRDVEIQWRSKASVYVSQGLATGDRIIISRIHRPISGTLLQTMKSVPEKQAAQMPLKSDKPQ
ncbi:MAG: efflux RND transporter periplasmic adaptor subunit [Deltaproteobacteria bacterium]|nr:efflux RND transporter periplasmic adaptor subunit [Deltaproteobacteria bacterium]MBT6434141.1 efflux RND transporter periplasmic adaptor subunit [Deltaproteobacteria bacterium]MBT6492704.1 efflux RND transporter periplasmic adaptor subunit [Deltaproteobacteria bacterium]